MHSKRVLDDGVPGEPRVSVMGKTSPGKYEQAPKTKREQVEQNLKRVYDETLIEPLPEKLAELLERLRKQEGR